MTRHLRLLFAASALATLAACDSLPGAIDPPPSAPAELSIVNGSSRTVAFVEARSCTTGDVVKYTRVSISPSRSWTGRYPEGCFYMYIEYSDGWNTARQVELTADAPVTIRLS